MDKMQINRLNVVISIFIWLIVAISLGVKCEPFYAVFFFLPFIMFPYAVVYYLIYKSNPLWSKIAILTSQILFLFLYIYVYLDAIYYHPDAQSAIAFVFVGAFSLIFMIPSWVIVILINIFKSAQQGDAPEPASPAR